MDKIKINIKWIMISHIFCTAMERSLKKHTEKIKSRYIKIHKIMFKFTYFMYTHN